DPDVRQRWLGEDAGDVAGLQGPPERLEVVELDDLRRHARVDGRAYVAASGAHPFGRQGREGLVDRSVVAPVKDEDLRSARDLAREPECPAVRVGRRQRELPEREAEAA